jgi:predicted exporter
MKHRAAVLALWLGALMLAAVQIARSEFRADLSGFLPATPDAHQRVLIEQLQSGLPSRTLLVGIEGGDAAARAAASRALAAALRAGGRFEQVHNGEREAFAAVGAWLFEQRFLLSPEVNAGRFSASGLRDAIGQTLSLLGTPAGTALKPLLARDPSGEMQRIAESLIPAGAPRTELGVWMARDAPRALLLASTKAPGADLDAMQAAVDSVHQAFAAHRQQAPQQARGLTLQLSGTPLFAVHSRATIEAEVRWLAIAGTLLMGVLLLAAFASPAALAVALLPAGSGVLAGIAAVGLGFPAVHGITLGFGATLIGEAVDYAIYYLIQARAGWRTWLASGWPTVRLGLWTSICGFAALVFSGFPGLAQLGVFSIAGLVGAALTTRWVLPALRPQGAAGSGVRGFLGRFALAALRRLPRWRAAFGALGALALVAVVLRGDPWRAELASLSPIAPEALALDARLRADLNASDARSVVLVQAADTETALQRAEAAAARLDVLVDQGKLAGYDSATRFLPSLATQRARQAGLPEAAPLWASLEDATRGGPLAAQRLGPFVDDVQRARRAAPLTREVLRGTPVAPLVDALLLARPDGSAAALLPLQAPLQGQLDPAAVDGALQGLAGTQRLDIKAELDRLYARYLHEARAQAALGALAVVALMAAALRSARRLAAVCLPLALALLLTLGALAAAQVPLSILHLVGLLLVVAVGSNYALFFAAPGRPGPGPNAAAAEPGGLDTDTLASLLLANLTTVASFGLLAFSQIAVLSAVGRVVAPGALLALVLAAAFAPRAGAAAGTGTGAGAGPAEGPAKAV